MKFPKHVYLLTILCLQVSEINMFPEYQSESDYETSFKNPKGKNDTGLQEGLDLGIRRFSETNSKFT